MIPLSVASFERPQPGSGPTLFFSVTSKAVGVVCEFVSGQGVLWLSGPEAGEPSNLDTVRGFFVPVELEAEPRSQLVDGSAFPNLTVLTSANSTAIKSASASGAARYYTVAGKPFGEPDVFAAFQYWQAVVTQDGHRHILLQHKRPGEWKDHE